MSFEWATAALRSFAVSLSSGRPAFARIWLCRHSSVTRTTSRFAASGVIVVFEHATVALAVTFFLALAALALPERLSPRAILATTFLDAFVVLVFVAAASALAGEANTRPAATAAAGRIRVKILCMAAISILGSL